jgi:cytochrome P450
MAMVARLPARCYGPLVPHPTAFDPFAAATLADPYPFYAALRRDAPIYPLPTAGYALVSRFDDCRAAALDHETYSSNLVAILFGQAGAAATLLAAGAATPRPVDVLAIADESAHARQRKLSNAAFSIRRVTALEAPVRALAAELIGRFTATPHQDWMETVAAEIPTRLICRLLGLPEDDRAQLRAWANDGSALLSGVLGPPDLERCRRSVGALSRYLATRFAQARSAPADDVLGDLARATQADASCLSGDEVVAILLQLLTAGSESTTALLGSAVLLLARDAALADRLRAAPDLIPTFIEEVVRLESPFQGHFRFAKRAAVLGGTPIAAGTRLMLLWGAANRDERQFPHPDVVDLARPTPSPHLGFGFGVHHCIGAALARLEARVVVGALLARTRRLDAPADPPAWVPSVMMRRLQTRHVTVEPA